MQRDSDYWPAVTVAAGSRECNANVAVTHFTTVSFSNASAAVTLAGEPGGRGRLVVMTAPKLAADIAIFRRYFTGKKPGGQGNRELVVTTLTSHPVYAWWMSSCSSLASAAAS